MKTGIITCALTALALSAGITSHAQTVSDKKAKRQNSGRKEETPAIQNQAASTTLGDLSALADLKAKMQADK